MQGHLEAGCSLERAVDEQLGPAAEQVGQAGHHVGAGVGAIAVAVAELAADLDAVDVLGVLGDDVDDAEEPVAPHKTPPGSNSYNKFFSLKNSKGPDFNLFIFIATNFCVNILISSCYFFQYFNVSLLFRWLIFKRIGSK